jgi:uncharacterized protein YdcH (DUF465 family)
MEQEKLRLQDEIKSYMERDKEHLQKHNTLYDEIQQVFFTIITSYHLWAKRNLFNLTKSIGKKITHPIPYS